MTRKANGQLDKAIAELVTRVLDAQVAPTQAYPSGTRLWAFGAARGPVEVAIVVRPDAQVTPASLALRTESAPKAQATPKATPKTAKSPAKAAKAPRDAWVSREVKRAVNRARVAAGQGTLGPQKAWQKGQITAADVAAVTSAGLDAACLAAWVAQDAPKATRKTRKTADETAVKLAQKLLQ